MSAQQKPRAMRDVFIETLCEEMANNSNIFFVSADLGSPALDGLRSDFPGRFVSVGIAEQNLIGMATGLALEGFDVFAYALAPFITMRACEQVRTDLALMSQSKNLNVNFIGVGAGFSYDVSGPTHHCIEDISIIRTFPNIQLFSPPDAELARHFVPHALAVKQPKYLRFDSKPLPSIYNEKSPRLDAGFAELRQGEDVLFVSTGYCTHKALRLADTLAAEGIEVGVIDLFLLKPYDRNALLKRLIQYKHVLTIEESFIGKGGLDSLVGMLILDEQLHCTLSRFGVPDTYVFDKVDREELHSLCKMGDEHIMAHVHEFLACAQ